MDIGSFIVGLAIAILTFAFVARPLFTHVGIRVTPEDRQLSQLQAERDRLLRSLQELEMDFAVEEAGFHHMYVSMKRDRILCGEGQQWVI